MATNSKRRLRRDIDVAVTISTRISLSKRHLIDDVVDREGISIREVIEQALEARWGTPGETAPRMRAVNE